MASLIRRYIGFQLLFNLLLWVPVFYEVQKAMGLSDAQIFGIQSIYYVAFCLLEVPTGYFADRFGYRTSMLCGAVVLAGANLGPVIWPSYQGFLGHFLAVAAARSLISGAASAYMYEAMKQAGAVEQYKRVEGDARFWSLVARIAAWSVVGWLMAWHLTLPYWISALNAAGAAAIVVTMPKITATMSPGAGSRGAGFVANAALALKTVARSPYLFFLMLQGVGLFVTARLLQVNLYQPLLRSRHFSLEAFGWVMAAMTVCEAVGSRFSHRLKPYLTDRAAVGLLTGAIGLAMVIIATCGRIGALSGFCLFSLATGLAFPVQKQLLNDAISVPHLRATMLSIESIIDRALCAVVVLPMGMLVATGRLDATLLWFGLGLGVAAVLINIALGSTEPKPDGPKPTGADFKAGLDSQGRRLLGPQPASSP